MGGEDKENWGPVLHYDSINDTENVRVTIGGYHGKPNDGFRVLVNYEVVCGRGVDGIKPHLRRWVHRTGACVRSTVGGVTITPPAESTP